MKTQWREVNEYAWNLTVENGPTEGRVVGRVTASRKDANSPLRYRASSTRGEFDTLSDAKEAEEKHLREYRVL